jgi:tetratricopeptide (TPR) repeat protein
MLNLVDHLVTRSRHLQVLGRTHDAVRLLHRLARFRELPAGAAEEIQASLGELELSHGNGKQARRHLSAALRHRPDSGPYHYTLAVAFEEDDNVDPQRALRHYRRALELQPDEPAWLCEYGRLLLRLGRSEEGLKQLRRAAELEPDDPEVVGALAEGLARANRADEGRAVLRAARFRNPREVRFRRLWDEYRFQEVRRAQGLARKAEPVADEGPVLLPFVRLAEERGAEASEKKVIRQDKPVPLPGPHVGRPAAKQSEQRKVR